VTTKSERRRDRNR